jgi:hypothetical protein
MRYASKHDIKQLVQPPIHSQAISIFIPTHRISLPHNLKADRVRMKNAIRDIVARLEKQKVSSADIKSYVSGLHKLHANEDFWRYRDNGLAIYAQKGRVVYYDLPIEIESSVHIGDNFIISPLLSSQDNAYSYMLLELNNHEPRFFAASQSGIQRLLINELPGELESALRIDEYQQRQQHSTSPGGSRDAHNHGHGGSNDNKYKDVIKYYRLIDKVLWENSLHDSNIPLIIAGDTSSATNFKKISRYRYIHKQLLSGNHEHTSEANLLMQSWALMVEEIEKQENLFKQLFDKAKHRDKRQALINGEHIKRAAKQGRIATLAISIIHRTYDSVVRRMEQRFKIELPSSSRQLKNIEQAARDVLNTGGEITMMLMNNDTTHNNLQYIKAITR